MSYTRVKNPLPIPVMEIKNRETNTVESFEKYYHISVTGRTNIDVSKAKFYYSEFHDCHFINITASYFVDCEFHDCTMYDRFRTRFKDCKFYVNGKLIEDKEKALNEITLKA